ncbi:MAG: DUF4381 domain-containing protein [Thiomicrospira sp.]
MNTELLSQLEDIMLPPAVGWWPLATSVWMVLITLFGLAAGIGWYSLQRYRYNAYRRAALRQLRQLPQDDDAAWLHQLNALLKQVAITVYGRQACAGLNQQAWLDFLRQKAGFIEQPEAMHLLTQHYQAQPITLSRHQREAILFYAKHWIEEHHL